MPKLTKLIHTLEWARIEDFVPAWQGIGRSSKDRCALANGFVAKAVLGLTTTVALIDRLTVDHALRRICGFSRWEKLPSDSPSPAPLSNLYDVMDAAYCKDLGHVPRVTITRAAARKLNSIPPKRCATTSARWRNGCPTGYRFA